MSYEIRCICGQAMRGERQARHQIIVCASCSRKTFVFPQSPFELSANNAKSTPLRLRSWRGPLLAAGVLLGLLLVSFAIALPYLTRPNSRAAIKSEFGDPKTLPIKIAEAREALAQGKFHVALRLCNEAIAARRKWPDALTPEENQDLTQLQRQAHLLAQLLPRALEEVVRHAKLVRDPEEWAAQFADYKGRGVVFDDIVKLDKDGKPVLANHVIEVDDTIVRLAWEDVGMLRNLPLEEGPRLIFGARLAQCTREEGGTWVIRFEPDSGVLLTDQGAVEACFPVKVENLQATLERQRRWLEQYPSDPRVRRERD